MQIMRTFTFLPVMLVLLLCGACGNENSNLNVEIERFTTKISTVDPAPSDAQGGRGSNQLIVYTPKFGKSTGTIATGLEAVVVDSVVRSVGGNNSAIPANGFVISGHGDAARWIATNITPGIKIRITQNELIAIKTVESNLFYAQYLLKKAKERIAKGLDKTLSVDSLAAIERSCLAKVENLRTGKTNDPKADSKVAVELAAKYFYNTFAGNDNELRTTWYRLEEKSPEELEVTIREMVDAGFNAICPETIYEGNSIYPDAHKWLTQNPNFVGWDPLKELSRLCKKYNMKLIPWIEVYFVGFNDSKLKDQKAEWLGKTKEQKIFSDMEPGYHFFCPSRVEVRKFWIDVYSTLLERYEIDGFQLDYIRYPVSLPYEKGYCYCELCRNSFKKLHKTDPLQISPETDPEAWEKWDEYRIQQIDTFVVQVSAFLHSQYPDVRLSADVFPSLEHSLTVKFQNWGSWLNRKLIEEVYIMAYTDGVQPVAIDTKYMAEQLSDNQCGYAGLGQFLGLPTDTFLEQIEAARQAGANGIAVFSWGYLKRDPEKLIALKQGPFRKM